MRNLLKKIRKLFSRLPPDSDIAGTQEAIETKEEQQKALAEKLHDEYPKTETKKKEVEYETWEILLDDGTEKKMSGIVEEEDNEIVLHEAVRLKCEPRFGHMARTTGEPKASLVKETVGRITKDNYACIEKVETETLVVEQEFKITADAIIRESGPHPETFSVEPRYGVTKESEPKIGFKE